VNGPIGTVSPDDDDAMALSPAVFALDCVAETRRIGEFICDTLARLHKRGVVLGLSGGVDSSVCAALAVQALGPGKVLGLLMPERESSPQSVDLGAEVARRLELRCETEPIADALEALGCYRRRDAAIRALFPAYGKGWKNKIAIAGGRLHFFKLVVQDPQGIQHSIRLPLREYLQIVAATSFKQRIRQNLEYFHADRLNYAVLGTPNRLEYDQGFFVKNGDGAADLKPIAHLYKTQVYALAEQLDLPRAVCESSPTTDTYSLAQGQDEFYFVLPYGQMDLALWAHGHRRPASELAHALGLEDSAARQVYADIEAKRRGTRYLHEPPALVEPVFDRSAGSML